MKKLILFTSLILFSLIGLGQNLPIAFSYESQMGTSIDQGNQGSCTAMACSFAQTFFEAREEAWNPKLPEHMISPAYPYNELRSLYPAMSGLSFDQMLNFIQQEGALFISQMPFNPDDYLTRPERSLCLTGLKYRIAGYHKSTNLDDAKKELINNGPIVSFITNPSGSTHSLCIVGYNDTLRADSTIGAFRIMNSLGPNWGENGFGWLPYHRFDTNFYSIENGKNQQPKMVFAVTSNLGTKGRRFCIPRNEETTISFLNGSDTIKKMVVIPAMDQDWLIALDTVLDAQTMVITSSYCLEKDRPTQAMEMKVDSCSFYDQEKGVFVPLVMEVSRIDSVIGTITPVPGYTSYLVGSWLKAIIHLPTKINGNQEKKSEGFSCFPNPFSGQISFRFSLTEESEVALEVYDLLGRPVWSKPGVKMSAGEKQIDFSSNLATGTYLAVLTINGQKKATKIIAR
ncbi:MAG: T9SS type A sorting domain-containing protein [Patescibacteria group bacterium]|jgi:hypothetical protein